VCPLPKADCHAHDPVLTGKGMETDTTLTLERR
jgi:hypothetical protein